MRKINNIFLKRDQEKKKGTMVNNKNNQKKQYKMAISTNLSIITLNLSGLNASIKSHRMAE